MAEDEDFEDPRRVSNFSLSFLKYPFIIGASSSTLFSCTLKGLKTKSMKLSESYPYIISLYSSVGGKVEVSGSEVTPVLTLDLILYMLRLMSKSLVASGMDLKFRASGVVELDDVVRGVQFVKMVDVNGMEI